MPPPSRTLAAAAVLAFAAVASAATTANADDAPGLVSPRITEQAYLACIDGAPTTPDSHERWATSCHGRAATGLN